MKSSWRIAKRLAAIVVTILLGGFLAASMMRLAPGSDSDERLLDPHLSAESQRALRQERTESHNVVRFYFSYLKHAAHGDFGTSESLNQPIGTLIVERLPATAKLTAVGLLTGWFLAALFAVGNSLIRSKHLTTASAIVSGAVLCIPTAVLGLLFVMWNAPASLALALVVFPKIYTYLRKLFARAYQQPHLIAARAKGLGELRIFGWHVLPNQRSQLLALAGISVNVALGAAIPIEALCGVPGIGQLAWQAALSRDLPLLVTLTVIVSATTMFANLASEFGSDTVSQGAA